MRDTPSSKEEINNIMQKIREEVKRKNSNSLNINKKKVMQSSRFYTFAKKVAKKLEQYGLYKFVNFAKNNITISQYR